MNQIENADRKVIKHLSTYGLALFLFLTPFGGVAGAGAECDFCPRRGGSGQDNKAKGTVYEKVNFCIEVVPEATWLGSEGEKSRFAHEFCF